MAKKTNPLLEIDFDQIQWWHTDRDFLRMTIQVGKEKKPRRFHFKSEAELQRAYDEYYGVGEFSEAAEKQKQKNAGGRPRNKP